MTQRQVLPPQAADMGGRGHADAHVAATEPNIYRDSHLTLDFEI